ncbi:MAG: M3 family metallopeptidase [Bdellovibrionales bacterium]|nr:M3 family metallopeptidase [Bdellovibrionales bacterium]
MNPLLKISELPHRAVPFDKIKTEHYLPALNEAIQIAKANIEQIKAQKDPNFSNVIEALETASDEVNYGAGIYFNLLSAEASEEHQALAKEISPLLSNFSSDINLDEELFSQVKKVYDNKAELKLSEEQQKLLQETYEGFERNGALLDKDKKQQLRKISERLSQLSPQFSENILKSTNAFTLHLADKADLEGLPESIVESAAHEAETKGKEGYVFTLQAPSFIPFMTYNKNRALREKMWRAYTSRSFNDDFDNQENILEIIKLRSEKAKLLGYDTHADFVLSKRMAESKKTVMDFLNKLLKSAKPAAEKEVQELSELAKKDDIEQLMPWDVAYYTEKLKHIKFDLEEEQLRLYFKLENVINGVFAHAEKLYDLTFEEKDIYPKYHKDVKVFEVYKKTSKDFIGLFYADFFPRDTKKAGAWMTNYYEQGLFQGKVMRPHVSIVCNFSKPTSTKPSLLTLNEVQTLFHEFGHSLHSLLSQCTYRSLSGTNVYWDFVELPSQLMENWTLKKEGLDLFAKHYQTQEPMPQELADKIKKSSQFMAGYQYVRQLSFGLMDMAWHTADPNSITSVSEFEQKALEPTKLLPTVDGAVISCGFSHIFAGGYSAGYYSYKWAEVLEADAFEAFEEKGVFDKSVATLFEENILSRGGTEHPMTLYKNFRGREPDPNALLRRDGLI